jgi:gamma-glutamylcyclotransferase (GGCT)/AIG2-like uncharacterized protein YtfP
LLGSARSLGAATTQGWLYDLGGYPGLVAGNGIVYGQICEVDDARLPGIDAFEDFDPDDPADSLYVRDVLTAWRTETGGDYRSGARDKD